MANLKQVKFSFLTIGYILFYTVIGILISVGLVYGVKYLFKFLDISFTQDSFLLFIFPVLGIIIWRSHGKKKAGLIEFKEMMSMNGDVVFHDIDRKKITFINKEPDVEFSAKGNSEIKYRLRNSGGFEVTFPTKANHKYTVTSKDEITQAYNFHGLKEEHTAQEFISSQYKIKPKTDDPKFIDFAFEVAKSVAYQTLIIKDNKVKINNNLGDGVFEQKDYKEFRDSIFEVIQALNRFYESAHNQAM